jgi:hypothetical protein
MPPPLDNVDPENLSRLRSTDDKDLARGIESVEGISPEAEAAHDRKDGLHLKRTIRKAKQAAVWVAVAAFAVLMAVLMFALCLLIATHIKFVLEDASKISALLEDAFGWIMIALSSLFIDRRLRGEK